MKPAADTLVFQWREKHHSLLVLFWFVILSFCVHALALYLFQVNYPSTVSIAPPPVQASLLTPSSPEYRTLIRWIEAGNPALVMSPPDTTPPGMLQSTYKPSYAAVHALPMEVTDQNEPVRFPASIGSPGAVTGPPSSQPLPAVTPISPGASQLRLSGALAGRKLKNKAEIHPPQKSSLTLKPSRFMAGVNDRGEVRYVFLEESCGDKNLDQWAEHHLLTQIDFVSAPENITWGVITYFWGDDACAPSR
jgi:hypothetical protein